MKSIFKSLSLLFCLTSLVSNNTGFASSNDGTRDISSSSDDINVLEDNAIMNLAQQRVQDALSLIEKSETTALQALQKTGEQIDLLISQGLNLEKNQEIKQKNKQETKQHLENIKQIHNKALGMIFEFVNKQVDNELSQVQPQQLRNQIYDQQVRPLYERILKSEWKVALEISDILKKL